MSQATRSVKDMVDCNTLLQFFETRNTFFENSKQLMVQLFTEGNCQSDVYPSPDALLYDTASSPDLPDIKISENAYIQVNESDTFEPTLEWFKNTLKATIDITIKSLYVPPRHSLFIFSVKGTYEEVCYLRVTENTAVIDLETLFQYTAYTVTAAEVKPTDIFDMFPVHKNNIKFDDILNNMHCIVVCHTQPLTLIDHMCISNDTIPLGNGINHLNDTWFPRSRNCDDHYGRLSVLHRYFPRQTKVYTEQEHLDETFPNIFVGACGFGSVMNRSRSFQNGNEPQRAGFFDEQAYHSTSYLQHCPIPASCDTAKVELSNVNIECSDQIIFPPYTDTSIVTLKRFQNDSDAEDDTKLIQVIPIIQMNSVPVIYTFVILLFLIILQCIITVWSMPFNKISHRK